MCVTRCCTMRRRPFAELRKEPLPPRLQQILDRGMAKEPRDRYQKMEELRDELRSVLAGSFVRGDGNPIQWPPEPARHLGGASPVSRAMRWLKRMGSGEVAHQRPQLTSPTSHHRFTRRLFTTIADQEKKSLAILCFRNLSNDPASSFYEFSLADAVITELARVRSLVVRPSSVIAKYQGQPVDPRGRRPGVECQTRC